LVRRKQLANLESASGHLAGKTFTLADLLSILYCVQKFPAGDAMVKGAKNPAVYFAKHCERVLQGDNPPTDSVNKKRAPKPDQGRYVGTHHLTKR
jgi:hypothetical protein